MKYSVRELILKYILVIMACLSLGFLTACGHEKDDGQSLIQTSGSDGDGGGGGGC